MYLALQLNIDGSTCAVSASQAPNPIPAGQVACTPDQYANFRQYTIVNGAVSALAAPALLAQAQAAQTLLVNNSAQGALAALVSAYPALEVSTWPQQVAEATAVTANPAAATPTLTAAATASGQTVAALAANVLAKSAAYTSAAGAIVGKRIALSNQIVEATTVAAVLAINW